jgi:opacity protein-like surface antigen
VSGRLVGAFKGELPAEAALRARIGTAIGNDVAVYIAGGPLAGRWKATNESGQSNSKVVLGGQAAVGLEYYLTPHWRVGAEYAYNYYDYENSGFTVGPISYVKPEPVEHIGRLLLSYVF